MTNSHDGYRPIFQRSASFDDSPAIRHYGVACDETTGELCLIEAEAGRVTGHIHLPREIAAQWLETLADYLPQYRNLFGHQPYYPPLVSPAVGTGSRPAPPAHPASRAARHKAR